jgi:hypothetical protein
MALFMAHAQALGQDNAKASEGPSPKAANEKGGDEDLKKQPESKPGTAYSDQIKQLTSDIEQLRLLVEQQRLALAEMQKRVDAISGKAEAATAIPTPPAEVAQAQRSDPAPSPAQKETKPADRSPIMAGWQNNHAFLRSSDGIF